MELTQLKPEIIDFQLALGKCYRKVKEFDAAAELYEDLKKACTNLINTWGKLSNLGIARNLETGQFTTIHVDHADLGGS